MNWQFIKNRLLLWLRRLVLYGGYLAVVFTIASFLILQVPAVQESLLDRYTKKLTTLTGFPVTFSSFYFSWWDYLHLEGLQVADPEKNVLLRAKTVHLRFDLTSVYTQGDINIDGASLERASVHLQNIGADTNRRLNLNVWIERLRQAFASEKQGGGSSKINIGEISLTDSEFIYQGESTERLINRFDPNHLHFSIDDGLLSNFKIIGDTTQFIVQNLQATEINSALPIRKLQTFFRYSQTALEFYNTLLETDQSRVADTLVFSYKSSAHLSDFTNHVHMDLRLKDSKLHPDDLNKFTGAQTLLAALEISGNIKGRIPRLSGRQLKLRLGQSTLKGRADFDGLPAVRETFLNLAITEGQVNVQDLAPFLPSRSMQFLQNLGSFRVVGSFVGFLNDFVADAEIVSSAGTINSDLNLKIDPQRVEATTYKGKLKLVDFDLGRFSKDTITFQRVTMEGSIEGRGITLPTANFKLNGRIPSLGLFQYTYTNIETNAQFAKEYFNGSLVVNDPNLQLEATGSIDLRNRKDLLNIKGYIDTARFDQLKLLKEELFVQTNFDINTEGLSLDSLTGNANLSQTKIVYNTRKLNLPELVVSATKVNQMRTLTVASSLFTGKIQGNFLFGRLFDDALSFKDELILNFENNRLEQKRYYAQKTKKLNQTPYATEIEVNLLNINPVFQLLEVPLELDRNILLRGAFSNGIATQFYLDTSIDTIRYGQQEFYETNIDLSSSKFNDSTHVLAMISIDSRQQRLGSRFYTEKLFTEAIWDRDHIDWVFDLQQQGKNNSLRLHSEIDFLQDSIRLRMLPSQIQALGEEWSVAASNSVIWRGREFRVQDFRIFHDDASITLNGFVSEQPLPELRLAFNHVNLALLNSFSTETFGGQLDGFITLQNFYGSPSIQNNVTISDLMLNDFLIGTLQGKNLWIRDRNEFDLNFELVRMNEKLMDLKGTYQPNNASSPLQLQAVFNKANIKVMEPLVKGIFSGLDGTLSGRYEITGTLLKPQIEGTGKIQNGKLRVDYLNTIYRMEGGLNMTASQIIFENMQLTDVLGNKAELEGRIGHRNFERFRFNIDCDFKNMLVLNTTAKDNSLFYGQAYSTGSLNIFGPIANLKISASAKSEKNTRIFIPIGGTASVEKKDFINFFHFTDSAKAQNEKPVKERETDLSGFVLDLNLDITPDAYAEIIFDIKAGDIIRGRGNGDLKLLMDSRGGFNMFGFVEFTEGAYNFTLYDIINKEFVVKPGSNIAWYGDPYQGTMNITASYRQLASLGPILPDQTIITAPAIRRKYPVEVLLKLDGPMLSPQIQFDMSAPEVPDNVIAETDKGAQPVPLKFQFEAFKARADEQELKKQVFSLIVLRRFSPPDAFNTSGTIQNSVSEFLSNQLSYWLSQMDQNLEIDFDLDLGTMNQEAFNTFQLRLSYSMLNGRLRITRDGTFGNVQTANVASVAGDWTVDYLLTPDGRFKVKMYSRSNFNTIQNTLGNQVPITTGFSLLHTQNFNELKDLLRSARDRRRRELKLEPDNSNEGTF
jgi:hypothetical protein